MLKYYARQNVKQTTIYYVHTIVGLSVSWLSERMRSSVSGVFFTSVKSNPNYYAHVRAVAINSLLVAELRKFTKDPKSNKYSVLRHPPVTRAETKHLEKNKKEN